MEECSVSYKLVYFRRHGPMAEHYGLKSGISRIWLKNQGQALPKRNGFFKQYAVLIKHEFFIWQRRSRGVIYDSKSIGE